ncbi:MAG: Cna B-type domain-containing protein [Clostridia bacterium]|nr:Cna B-type domain-containing protein [Clostridia bacterium]
MKNRKFGILIILLCFCLHLLPFSAMAASTSDAVEPIIPENECSLTVSYCSGDTAFSGIQVKLYRIAEVSADFKYTLTQPFEASGLVLNGIRTSGEWDVVRSTLEAHILAYNIAPEVTAETKDNGQASFEALKTGMYLAIADQAVQDDLHYDFDSALIALPGLGPDGRWQYQTSANAKGEILPPIDPDEQIEFRVLKLWRGDEERNDRPQSIEIELFCDGNSYETVILSEENHWTYHWSAGNDGSEWTVIERNVPQGYTVTVEERESTFVLTNTWTPTNPDDPVKPPPTGDTPNILLYALLMVGAGSMLVIVGITRKKARL